MLNSKLNLSLSLITLAAVTALADAQNPATSASETPPPAAPAPAVTNAPAPPAAPAPAATPAPAAPAAPAVPATQPAPAPATQVATPTPPPNGWDQWLQKVKNPTINWGADVRLRNEYLNNALTLSDTAAPRHEQDYFRFRERVWLSFSPYTDTLVSARLAAEQREWMKPANASQYFENATTSRSGFEERYGILDNAIFKWTNILGQPLTFSGGRQDITLGDPDDQWLVMDGTPGDGSWTFFFDSLRATYELKEAQTKLDLIYLYQNALPDEWIPTIGRSGGNLRPDGVKKPYYLTEQDEQGIIAYLSNKSLKDMQIDGYFIYKADRRTDTTILANGDNADIYTLGAKVTGTPEEHWSYSAEGAYQFGSKQDPMVQLAYKESATARQDICAFGGKVRVNYLVKDPLKNQVSFVGEFLSGDRPGTKGQDEMFDVLWGRWPRWTELGTWDFATETGGKYLQMNNLGRVGLNWNVTPIKGMNFNAMYNALFAPESIPTRTIAPTRFSNSGNFRGHYLQSILKYQFNKNVSAQVKGELLWEGDYYHQRDLMSFLRTELNLTF